MSLSSVLWLFSFVFGLVLGSFANVCVHRIPLKQSIIHPPSTCPNCNKRIRFYDNIPLISYLLLLGKCRYCSYPISFQYPTVEAVLGFLSLALFIKYGLSIQYFFYLLFTMGLLIISFIDLKHQIIPDVISLPGIVSGFIASFFLNELFWLDSLIGVVGGGGFLFLIAFLFERITGREGMGGGDIKLLAMIGAWMGWRSLPFIVLISSVTGILIGGGSLLFAGKGYRVRIPFGPFLSLGALIYFFFGTDLLKLYLSLLT